MSNFERENRDWSDALRDSLRDAEQMPSAELWSRIESSAPPAVPRRLTLARWGMAIAAMLLVGLFATNLMTDHHGIDSMKGVEEVESDVDIATVISDDDSDYVADSEEYISQAEPDIIESVEPQPLSNPIQLDAPQPVEPAQMAEIETDVDIRESATTSESPSTQNSEEQATELEPQKTTQQPIKYYPPKSSSAKRVLALNVAGGGGSSSGTPARTSLSPHGILSPSGYKEVSLMEAYDASDVSHRQPLSFELTLGRSVASRLNLVSGISYTLLNSDLSVSNGQNMLQRLQFIGIPLRLETPLWSGERVSLYVGAGGQLEYCLSATIDGKSVDERRWHSSLGGSIGAQYNINKTIGLYCEPDLSYYFNQTKLITIRDESPLAFTMRFGIRFALE